MYANMENNVLWFLLQVCKLQAQQYTLFSCQIKKKKSLLCIVHDALIQKCCGKLSFCQLSLKISVFSKEVGLRSAVK